jgi:plastocyanin
MRLNAFCGFAAMAAFAGVLSGCGEHRVSSPLSPSSLSARSSEDVRPALGDLIPRRVDNDGDGYEDPEPGPTPDPGTDPPANPEQPSPDGAPLPVQLTVSVVASFGSSAFAPNPLQAAIGNTIVWTNNDLVPHNIVFDDGTPIGNLAPGQSSMPIPLAAETASYHCTFHPTMVGTVTTIVAPPTDPSGNPTPPTDPSGNPIPPTGPPAPAPDPYGDGGAGDDGYGEYDYY